MNNSPLATLPAELRNSIYELTLVMLRPLLIVRADKLPTRERDATAVQPPLTMTCRQIRSETLLFYYSHNSFQIPLMAHLFDHDHIYAPFWASYGIEASIRIASLWLRQTADAYHAVVQAFRIEQRTDALYEYRASTLQLLAFLEELKRCGYTGDRLDLSFLDLGHYSEQNVSSMLCKTPSDASLEKLKRAFERLQLSGTHEVQPRDTVTKWSRPANM